MKDLARTIFADELSILGAEDLSGFSQVFVLTDENTKTHCYPILQPYLPSHRLITIPAGEPFKTLTTCQMVWQALTRHQADRQALVINLGGGVVCDLGGFCAATYKRGIAFWHVPTTLLAQVDAAYGGKLGVDFQGFKNMLGAFRQPELTLVWRGFLQTLPRREARSGLAEMLKHGLIADAEHWKAVSAQAWGDHPATALIKASAQIKWHFIRQDPMEKSIRKALNFGHTVGHAVESYCLSHAPLDLLHGEAIAIGMVCEAWLSHQIANLPADQLQQITQKIKATFGQCHFSPAALSTITQLAFHDKKNQRGNINCSLIPKIGQVNINQKIEENDLKKSLEYYIYG